MTRLTDTGGTSGLLVILEHLELHIGWSGDNSSASGTFEHIWDGSDPKTQMCEDKRRQHYQTVNRYDPRVHGSTAK